MWSLFSWNVEPPWEMPIHVTQMELLGDKTVCAVVLTGVPRLHNDIQK